MSSRNSRFNDGWICQLDATSWLTRGKDDTSARCKACNTEISVARGGIQVLKTHKETAKHKVIDSFILIK